MKMQSLKLFAAALVLGVFTVLASTGTASAQQILSFDVPFEFSVSGKKMEAGNYELSKVNTTIYVLRNKETKESVIVTSDFDTAKSAPVDKEALVFNRYGESYFLNQIFTNRNQRGRGLAESKQERALRKNEGGTQLAKNRTNTERVSVGSAQ